MPAAPLSIATIDQTVPFRLMGAHPRPGSTREIHNAGVLLYQGESSRGSALNRYRFVVEFGSDNAAGAMANWLWTELHGHASALKIGEDDVPVQHAAIKRALLAAAALSVE
jgi:hypothetical protein